MASGIRRKKRNLKTGGLKVDISKTAQAKPITFYDRLKTREGLGECIVLEQQYSCKPDTFATDRDEIGQGHYGVVCKMLHEPSQTIMAVKEVSITTADPKSHEHLLNDLDVVRQARHDNIVRYFGFDYHEDTLRIMLECCLCDWRHILDRAGATNQTIPEPIVARFAHSVTSGLVYLHQQLNTMHRDVKPSNVLLASDGLIKLCDFGICKVVEDPSRLSDIKTVVGCNVYLPPERIKGATSYDSRSDVWSLGVTLLRLTTLFDFPFPSSNPTGLYALMQFLSEGKRERCDKSILVRNTISVCNGSTPTTVRMAAWLSFLTI
eukprot:TRINITY_DN12461_c0_g1_i8.p2 TRINITY_DN12461_c0_g1~~TRINITY_DN12461_c0_g1_i8.p2  ORF type:complete len:321 (+),score=75.04 TRINITY_DN12461_c0_g1_i8:246-1208(+)